MDFSMVLPEDIKIAWKKKIKKLSLFEMELIYYLSPTKCEVFRNYDLWSYFMTILLDNLKWNEIDAEKWAGKNILRIFDAIRMGTLYDLLERPHVDISCRK